MSRTGGGNTARFRQNSLYVCAFGDDDTRRHVFEAFEEATAEAVAIARTSPHVEQVFRMAMTSTVYRMSLSGAIWKRFTSS